MTSSRKERRALRARKVRFIREDEGCRTVLAHCAAWLQTKPGFERASLPLRQAVVIELCSRDRAEFATFGDRETGGGIHLIDAKGRPISIATLVATKVRPIMTGGLRG